MAGKRNDQIMDEQKIRKDERKKVKGKKRAKRTIITMFASLIAFLMAIFGGFLGLNPVGFYGDGSGSHSIIRSNDTKSMEEPDPVSMAEENKGGTVQIIVDDKYYIYQQQTYDLEGIREVIENLETNQPVELVDKYAVNLVFEDIQKIFEEANVEYNIVEDYD